MQFIHSKLTPIIYDPSNPQINCIIDLPAKWQKDGTIVTLLNSLDTNLQRMDTKTRRRVLQLYNNLNIDTILDVLPKLTQVLITAFLADTERRHKLVDLRSYLEVMLFPLVRHEDGIFSTVVQKVMKSLKLVNLQGVPIKDTIGLNITDIL